MLNATQDLWYHNYKVFYKSIMQRTQIQNFVQWVCETDTVYSKYSCVISNKYEYVEWMVQKNSKCFNHFNANFDAHYVRKSKPNIDCFVYSAALFAADIFVKNVTCSVIKSTLVSLLWCEHKAEIV